MTILELCYMIMSFINVDPEIYTDGEIIDMIEHRVMGVIETERNCNGK